MSEYQPGVCNIGRDERRRRRIGGVFGLLAAAGYVAFVIATDRSAIALLGAFPLLFGGFLGFVQDRLGFCVGFAALARYDLSGSADDAGSVETAEAVKRDRKRALRVLAITGVLAAVVTGAVYAVGSMV